MKNINTGISDEAHKKLMNYKMDHKLKSIGETLEIILMALKVIK